MSRSGSIIVNRFDTWSAHVSTLPTVIDPDQLLRQLCVFVIDLLGFCLVSVEMIDTDWLISLLCRLWLTLIGSCVKLCRLWSTMIGSCVKLSRLWSTLIGSWFNWGQSQSTETTHEPIKVNHNRQSWQMSESGSKIVNRVETLANLGQSKSTFSKQIKQFSTHPYLIWSYLTHEPIKVNNSQQSDTWADQGQSLSTESLLEPMKINYCLQIWHMSQSGSITVNIVLLEPIRTNHSRQNWRINRINASRQTRHMH